MRDFRRLPVMIAAFVWLGFTGPWAATAHAEQTPDEHDVAHWVENPYAPHVTDGPAARIGTMVGFLYNERLDVTAVGLASALGHRFGRLTLESEYAYLALQERGPSSLGLGTGHRLGALARFDVIRIGPRYVGGNSLLSLYVEGGGAIAWNVWRRPSYDEAQRLVPHDTKRPEAQVGFGVEIDHRLEKPIGFPKRIGWFLGWRLAAAPHEATPASICRGVSCRPAPMMPKNDYVDRSMLFQSSLAVTW